MTAATESLLILTLGMMGILLVLSIIGEVVRARVAGGAESPTAEIYMTRVQSWWAMVLLLSVALIAGRGGAMLLFAFCSFAALREFLTMTTKRQADHLSLAAAFFVVLPAQYVFVAVDWARVFTVFVPVYAFLFLPVISALRRDPRNYLERVAETQWALMICVYCLSHIPALLILDLPGFAGREVLLIAFLVTVVQSGDLLDFTFGRRIGRRRIVPGISPKTWEGAACGVASAALIGAALHWLTPFGPLGAAAMAAAASAVGQAGAIVLKTIKAGKGVRDWSHLIPGQGGFMDQLDSVIFAAPVFFHLCVIAWGG